MRRRVVVTGIGCINPLGHHPKQVWDALMRCESGVASTTIFPAERFPTRIAAEVKNWNIADAGEDASSWSLAGRHTKFAVGAAKQAVEGSGILDAIQDPMRLGVYLGSGEGDQDFPCFARMLHDSMAEETGMDDQKFAQLGLERLDGRQEVEQEPNLPSSYLAALFDAQGPNLNCLTACAASSQAIGEATEIIRRGEADAMISGGAHSMIHPFGVSGFNLLTALSTRNDEPTKASRPFDKMRDGFVLGEGAGMLVLEELEHAKNRGANIVAEIIGYGSTADAYRVTDIHPEGRGAAGCMSMALKDARLNIQDIHYVNAHGTSTAVNDRVETRACKQVFGDHAANVPVSSTKSMMGHLIAAAGATELIVCMLAIQNNVLPPTINYEFPDPDCDLDYIPNQPRETNCQAALNNSFGFGGQNITIAVGEFVA